MEYIKQQFESFLGQNVPNASLSSVDDVVLGYTLEVLSDVCSEDTSFDIDQFCEMISAYIPEFAEIDSALVCEWLFQLAGNMKKRKKDSSLPITDSNIGLFQNEEAHNHANTRCDSTPDNSETSESHSTIKVLEEKLTHCSVRTSNTCGNTDGSNNEESRSPDEITVNEEHLSLLVEMFPESSKESIKLTLCRNRGDLDATIQALLDANSEQSRDGSLKQVSISEESSTNENKLTVKGNSKTKLVSNVGTDTHLKDFVLSRYEFVDTKEDKRVHKPLLPKQEPDKKIRYRDNHVVSTKGERFTVLTKKDQEGDEMKKTYVSIKPLRKYRFH